MDAFVKTRRNRPSPVTGSELTPGLQSSSGSSDGNSTRGDQQYCRLDLATHPRHLEVGTGFVSGSVNSSGYDPSASSDDRQSICSSPISEYSFSSSSSEESCGAGQRHATHDTSSYLSGWLHDPNLRLNATSSPLFLLDPDVMAQMLAFLGPSEVLRVLTMPLCKEWQRSYGSHQDLWKTMCLLEPFKANVADDADDSSSSSDSFCALQPEVNNIFGEYRLMFTSFVRCCRYLDKIEEDTRNGKVPSVIDYGQSGFPHFGMSRGLKKFLEQKKGVLEGKVDASAADVNTNPVGVTDDGYRKRRAASAEGSAKKVKYADSMITSRLLGPSSKGEPSHLHLSRSCAIYSIVNWMVAYPQVEGIQIKCVAILPVLLEDESQRLMAQRVGLVEVVLRAMLRFPDCSKLHVAAFHAMVLLARPLGGREGMLFDTAMTDSSANSYLGVLARPPSPTRRGVASLDRESGSKLNGINGIAVMLDSMRRFEDVPELQAMSCWALVNLALVPAQKTMILTLGGIDAATNAMRRHPFNYDVQFRALFALINLVVTSKSPRALSFRSGPRGPNTEKEVLDASVQEVANLVVLAMKNFCSSGTILNRACLVLHNLAQSQDYLAALLWTNHCYQMLEWCIVNYPTDPVLRRSATSTLHRLQLLLSNNERLRIRFGESMRAQSELSLPQQPTGQQIE